MATYSVRCRNGDCRHRRVTATHPDDYKVIPPCGSCGKRLGWRIEGREYNKRNLCNCGGPINSTTAMTFPHKKTHPLCDHHPVGFYNQARRAGISDDDIPYCYHPVSTVSAHVHGY
jgi:hypothetical protein